MELAGDDLVPLATHGLAPEVLGRRFARREHPRLDLVVARRAPVRFAADSSMPDPYDGLLLVNPDATRHVHACLGCPLVAGETVIGILTADALEPGAFDDLDDRFLRMLGALAGPRCTRRVSSRPSRVLLATTGRSRTCCNETLRCAMEGGRSWERAPPCSVSR